MTSQSQSVLAAAPLHSTGSSAARSLRRSRVTAERILGDAAAWWLVCFCAVVPIRGSKVLWVVTVAGMLAAALTRRSALTHLRFSPLLLLFSTWLVASTAWSILPGRTLFQAVMWSLFGLAGMVLAVGRTRADLMRLVSSASAVFLGLNLLIGVLLPATGRQSNVDGTAIKGLFVDKNQFGFFAVFALVACVHLALSTKNHRQRRLAWARCALCVVAMLSSASMTALSVAMAAMGVTWLLRRLGSGRRPMLLPALGWLLVIALAAVAVVSNWTALLHLLGRNPSLTGRTRIWFAVENAIRLKPWAGYGWKALWVEGDPTTLRIWEWTYNVPFAHAHDGYLDVTAQLGIIGLALFLLFLLGLLMSSARAWTARPTAVNQWPVVVIVMILIYNATEVVGLTNTAWMVLVALASMPSDPPGIPNPSAPTLDDTPRSPVHALTTDGSLACGSRTRHS